jgi:spermidine synthase
MVSQLRVDAAWVLFNDRRATVLVEDGRHYLMATDEYFDIINADLFVPFSPGRGQPQY